MKKTKELTFNQKLERLEEISAQLEDDSIELESAIALYEEGTQLAAACLEALRGAELRVTQLQSQAAGIQKTRSAVDAVPEEDEAE